VFVYCLILTFSSLLIEFYLGSQIFIHGGVSEEEEFLNDSFCLNLNPLKWLTLPIADEANAPVLAFHTACLVLPSEIANNPKLNILKYPEQGIGRRIISRVLIYLIIN